MAQKQIPGLVRFALGGILAWSSPSRGAPPKPAPDGQSGASRPEVNRDGNRDGIVPSPLVSRSKRVVGWSSLKFAKPENVNDGNYSTAWGAGHPTPERPAWVAIDIGVGPKRVLVNWVASGSFNYEETDYGSPAAYRIETSGDSTNGEDGSWRTAADVLGVSTHGQTNSFGFAGQRWVKFVVTRTPAESPNGVQITEIDVHDVTAGGRDCWFFLGDSITALAFDRAPGHQPSFAERVHASRPAYFPAMVDGGTGGTKSDEGAEHIGDWLARNPDAYFWAIGYGTNDAAGNTSDTARFRKNVQTIIDRVRAAGRVPILATIPFASDNQHQYIPRFNQVVSELQVMNGLPSGPDLYTWFEAHSDELRDGVHPNQQGVVSTNRLWSEAVGALYR
jgi:lysophospholipase L1-like esterase